MRNLALWGEAAKALFFGGLRGVLLLFSSKGRLGGWVGLAGRELEQSQGVEPTENQRWERRKGRLGGQSQRRAPLTYPLHPARSGAGKGDPQVFSLV